MKISQSEAIRLSIATAIFYLRYMWKHFDQKLLYILFYRYCRYCNYLNLSILRYPWNILIKILDFTPWFSNGLDKPHIDTIYENVTWYFSKLVIESLPIMQDCQRSFILMKPSLNFYMTLLIALAHLIKHLLGVS